jgi:hypothetical protein
MDALHMAVDGSYSKTQADVILFTCQINQAIPAVYCWRAADFGTF